MTATDRTTTYDAIVVGAGQAGSPLSTALAQAGWKTALIERKHVGGTCINEGCTPTKTMIASARVAHVARRAADYGVHIGRGAPGALPTEQVTVNMAKVQERKRAIVESFRGGSRRRVENAEGLDLLMGEGRFTGPRSLEVRLQSGDIRHLSADKVFINTGARPRKPSPE